MPYYIRVARVQRFAKGRSLDPLESSPEVRSSRSFRPNVSVSFHVVTYWRLGLSLAAEKMAGCVGATKFLWYYRSGDLRFGPFSAGYRKCLEGRQWLRSGSGSANVAKTSGERRAIVDQTTIAGRMSVESMRLSFR